MRQTMKLIYNGERRRNGGGIAATLQSDHENRITHNTNIQVIGDENMKKYVVRRLTPEECERLQGYPRGWTRIGTDTEVVNKKTGEKEVKRLWYDSRGKAHELNDSARYKAIGNSIALPQWWWLSQRLKPYLPGGAKLGSLFDGMGGFPLVWQRTFGDGTARWASEIEEFPIAVTKLRFPESMGKAEEIEQKDEGRNSNG